MRRVAGIYDHGGWAFVVCCAGKEVIDSRRIDLKDPELPNFPHHHQGQKLPLDEAIALVARVRSSAQECIAAEFDRLPASVAGIAIRKRAELPVSVADRITNYQAQAKADTVMYREVMQEVAAERNWLVFEYEAKSIIGEAARVLRMDDIADYLASQKKIHGPPWRQDHKLATAAAMLAAESWRLS